MALKNGLDVRTVKAHKDFGGNSQTVAWSVRKTGYYLFDEKKGFSCHPVSRAVKGVKGSGTQVNFVPYHSDCGSRATVKPYYVDVEKPAKWSGDVAKSLGLPQPDGGYAFCDDPAMWAKISEEGYAPGEPFPEVPGYKYLKDDARGMSRYDGEYVKAFRNHWAEAEWALGDDGEYKTMENGNAIMIASEKHCKEAIIRELGYWFCTNADLVKMVKRVKAKHEAQQLTLKKDERKTLVFPTVYCLRRPAGGSSSSRTKERTYDKGAPIWDVLDDTSAIQAAIQRKHQALAAKKKKK